MFVYILIMLINLTECILSKNQPTQPTIKTPTSIPLTYVFNYEAAIIFQSISFPLQDINDKFTVDIFTKIDNDFGSNGLNLNQDQIILIKKTYLYLIFLTKLELVKNNTTFKKYQPDFSRFLTDNKTPQPHIPDDNLVKSIGWQEVTITTDDILNSSMWKLFCKSQAVDAYNFFYTSLNIIHNVEGQIFNYIPHIETSFYDHDFTNLRSIDEIIRLKSILETTNKNFYLSQCQDWKKSSTQTSKNSTDIETQIVAFRQTQFYKNTHDIYQLLGIKKDNNATIMTKELLKPIQLESPLKEQVWCYFMLNELLTMFYGIMKPETIENVLTSFSTDNLIPKVFPYTIDDYVYFEELLAIKSKTENTHTQSVHSSPPVHKVEESHVPIALHSALNKTKKSIDKNVKTQGFFDFITHIADKIASVATDVGNDAVNSAEDVESSIEDAAVSAAHAAAGIAEGVFGGSVGILGNITGVEAITEFGTEVQKEAINNLETSTTDMQNSINELANGIKSGIAAEAEIDGDLIGIITDDKKLGQDFQTSYNQVVGSLVNVAAKYADLIVQKEADIEITEVRFDDQFADLVASAAGALYSGNWDAVGKNAEYLVNGTIKSISQSFSNLVGDAKDMVGAAMQGLGAIINTLTTVFIDVTREVTFIVMSAANVSSDILKGEDSFSNFESAVTDAKQTRTLISNALETQRPLINQCMGVAIAIGFTAATMIGTGGAAAAVDAPIDAALISGDIAAEAGAEVGAEVGAEAGTEVGVETGAETGIDSGTDTGLDSGTGTDAGPEPTTEPTTEPTQTTNEPTDEDGQDENDSKNNEQKDDSSNISKLKSLGQGALKVLGVMGNVMNIVFGSFNIISGLNSDAQNILKEQQQSEQLTNIWTVINDNKIAITQNQGAYLKELQFKQQATIGNQILSLSFIKNITYSQVDNFAKQLSQLLAKNYIIPSLKPDNNGMYQANIGTSWAIQSPYLNLYPTQGFYSITSGRNNFPFSQEVAETPYAANDIKTSSKKPTTSIKQAKQPKKLWFNQKVLAMDNNDENGITKKPSDPLHITIDMQIIYMVKSSFYTGLYLGGNYYDYTSTDYLTNLTKNQDFDIDAAHLAKMVVLFRDSATAPLQIGVYEHEGKNWILKEKLPSFMQLDTSHIYNIDATLNNSSLTLTVTFDNNSKNIYTKTVNVTPIENQRTYGIISSGTAIQWNQITPNSTITINRTMRPFINKPNEISREKASKIARAKAANPVFGSMKLQIISPQAILLGQYLYSTTDTNIKNILPKNSIDYVIFAINQNGTIKNIGSTPPSNLQEKNDPTVIVSVITGNAYNSSGNVIAHCGNLWETYEKQFGPFSDTLATYIATTQQQISASLSRINFGSFELDIISKIALQNLQYIYSCSQTIIGTDSSGKQIQDYLITAEISGKNIGNSIGMAPTSNNAQGLVSLVSGNLYEKTTVIDKKTAPTPINQGYYELNSYISQAGTIDATDMKKITDSQAAYSAYQTIQKEKAAAAQTPQIIIISSSPTTSSSLNSGTSLGDGPSIDFSNESPSQSSISTLQQDAAGSAGIQLGTPTGPSVSLGNGP